MTTYSMIDKVNQTKLLRLITILASINGNLFFQTESSEHIADIIYSALDRNGNGCVPLSAVLEYIQNEIHNSEIPNSPHLCDLEQMLRAHKRKCIDRLELMSVIKSWVEKIVPDAKSEILKPETLADCSQLTLLTEELPFCEGGPLNISTHSCDSPERVTKREYNDMVDKLASMSKIIRVLEDENFSLKEHEEHSNAVLIENENLKKTVAAYERKLENFQNLQQEYVETNSALQMAESNNRELKLKLQKSEKICANLQQKLDEIVEQKCETTAALEKANSSLTEYRKKLSAQKEAYESLRLKYEADKHILCDRIATLEDMINGLESKNKILNENKSELELKVTSMLEESANMHNSWHSFLSDSSSGSSICLQSQGGYCHQFCGTESIENYKKTLYAELQASGDLCLTHKQLEEQLREWQEKAIKYRKELDDYEENEKVAAEIVKSVMLHLELSEHCGDMYENKSQIDLIAEVENITKFVKANQSLSYLISFVTAVSEKEHSFRKISKRCLVHPREVYTQTDSMVTSLPVMDQTVQTSCSERGTQAQADCVLTKLSTMDETAQISGDEKYTQTDPVATEILVMDQTAQISFGEKYTQMDPVVPEILVMDQTAQISTSEKYTQTDPALTEFSAMDQIAQDCVSEKCTQTQANPKISKVTTMGQTTQISNSEISTQVQSGAPHPSSEEDVCTRTYISIESRLKSSSQIPDNLSPKTEPLIPTLLPDDETSCGSQESKMPLKQTLPFQTNLHPIVNGMFVDRAPESTFHSALFQHMKKFLKAAVSFKTLRRTCTLAVSLLLILVISSLFLNLFVDCCLYSQTFCGTLCSVMEDVFKPYVQLRHLSPPPT